MDWVQIFYFFIGFSDQCSTDNLLDLFGILLEVPSLIHIPMLCLQSNKDSFPSEIGQHHGFEDDES